MQIFFFFLKLAIATTVLLALLADAGSAHIVWRGYEIETSATVLGIGVLLFAVFVHMIFRLWRSLWEGPRFWSLRNKIKKMTTGQDYLTRGFAAIAAGDGSEAGRLALAARKALGTTQLVRLLQAQAAQLSGDHDLAREIFQSLSHENDSAILGYRGLIMSAIRQGRWDEAERQADKLQHVKPETPWLSLIKFTLETRKERWSEADRALTDARKARLIAPERANRQQAALLLARAYATGFPSGDKTVLQLAEQAVRLAPNWLPAILLLAKEQTRHGHERAALRLIERSWAQHPHPELAALYGSIGRKAEEPIGVYQQIQRLTRTNTDTTTSQMALAEAALAADVWGAARKHLLSIASRKDATQSVFRLLSRLERRESGDDKAAALWLQRIADALPDPRWICQTCGGSHQAWQCTCLHCGSFNTLEWQIPGSSRTVPTLPEAARLLDV